MTTREAAFTSAALQEQYRAPHPLYDELRAFDPIYYDREARRWLVTSRKAITRVLGDPRFESHLHGTRLNARGIRSTLDGRAGAHASAGRR
jgi:cytochrome P450